VIVNIKERKKEREKEKRRRGEKYILYAAAPSKRGVNSNSLLCSLACRYLHSSFSDLVLTRARGPSNVI
jgi:hypothetical protein